MTSQELIEKLDKLFTAKYSKQLSDLNKNVYPAAKTDTGSFEVPLPILGPGGGTIIMGNTNTQLKPPAVVSVSLRNMEAQSIIYRIIVPYHECEIASQKIEYFNYLFDAIITKALGNYEKTVGSAETVRFGECYIDYKRADGKIFTNNEDGYIELQLRGCWASSREDYT